jgi:hypothetical protein
VLLHTQARFQEENFEPWILDAGEIKCACEGLGETPLGTKDEGCEA